MEDILETLIAAVDWEATYISLESEDDEVRRRALIMLECSDTAKAALRVYRRSL